MYKELTGLKQRILLLLFILVTGIIFVTAVPGSASADTVGPKFTGIFPATGAAIPSAKVTISLTAVDQDKVNFNSVVMTVDNAPVKTIRQYGWIDEYTDDYTKLEIYYPGTFSEGQHNIIVTAKDMLGNTGTFSWNFTVGEAPKITLQQPTAGSMVNILQPVISAKVTDNTGIDSSSIVMTVAGSQVPAAYDPITSTVSYVPAQPLINETFYDVSLQAKDTSGNLTTSNWKFYVNTFQEMTFPQDDANCQKCHARTQHPMNNCSKCHGTNLNPSAPQYPLDDCYACHFGSAKPATYHNNGLPFSLKARHNPKSTDSCMVCHTNLWGSSIPSLHNTFDTAVRHTTTSTSCTRCHAKTLTREHQRHTDAQGNPLTCFTCHNNPDPNIQNVIKTKNSGCEGCHTGNPHHNSSNSNCLSCHNIH